MSNPVGKCEKCNCGREHGTIAVDCRCACHSVDNWEEKLKESDVYKRIMAVESMAFVHGAKSYEGQTLTEFIRELLLSQHKALLDELENVGEMIRDDTNGDYWIITKGAMQELRRLTQQ